MPTINRAVVLDAWPVLEHYAGKEPSASEVQRLLRTTDTPAIMSTVNFAEVCSSLVRDRGPQLAESDARWLRARENIFLCPARWAASPSPAVQDGRASGAVLSSPSELVCLKHTEILRSVL